MNNDNYNTDLFIWYTTRAGRKDRPEGGHVSRGFKLNYFRHFYILLGNEIYIEENIVTAVFQNRNKHVNVGYVLGLVG